MPTAPEISLAEDPAFLREQLITCIGNKRALLPFLEQAFDHACRALGRDRLTMLDAFAGSGVVSRLMKRYASRLIVNDLEEYAAVSARCYLADRGDIDEAALEAARLAVVARAEQRPVTDGIIRRLYAPLDDADIQPGERVFYTVANAVRLDSMRLAINEAPEHLRPYLLAPLLAAASVHANTSGVFKGFYKDRDGRGRFGGAGGDALRRILGRIELQRPVFSRFECELEVHQRDANALVRELPTVDVAYFDPPYNQHPYGSNYFMLNLLCRYVEPREISQVSGIPVDWNRSDYNRPRRAMDALADLVHHTKARFLIVSYNDEGFIAPAEMQQMLEARGRVTRIEHRYNTFRGSRNLRARRTHVQEQLFVVDCRDKATCGG